MIQAQFPLFIPAEVGEPPQEGISAADKTLQDGSYKIYKETERQSCVSSAVCGYKYKAETERMGSCFLS